MDSAHSRIRIIGHGDKSEEHGFDSDAKFVEFIRNGVLNRQGGRYRYSKRLKGPIDIIVLSREGLVYGHFEIEGRAEPNARDREDYPKVQQVLLVRRSFLYDRIFRIEDELGIAVRQAPKGLSADEFSAIQAAGRGSLIFGDESSPELGEHTYVEGARQRITVNRWERDRDAVRTCKQLSGTQCAACEVDLGTIYGDIGAGYIHVHHLTPGASYEGEHRLNAYRDLKPVCPNCHAMIHRHWPPFTIEYLRERLREIATRRNKT